VKGLHFASEDKVRELGGVHGSIKTGVFHYEKKKNDAKECVKYWYKDPSEEFVSSMESIMNVTPLIQRRLNGLITVPAVIMPMLNSASSPRAS